MSRVRWDRWELPIGLAGLLALAAAVGAGGSLSGPIIRDTAYLEGDADPARLPRRIVSTALVTDEILLALVSPDRVACVTEFADNVKVSNAIEAAKQVAGRNSGDMERILVHDPDLVLLARFSRGELVDLLTQSGVPMRRMLAYDSLADIRANVIWVGRAVGAVDKAHELVRGMDDIFARVRTRVAGRPRPRILYYGTGGYTPGAGTVFDELVAIAGGVNVAAEAGVTGHGHLSIEAALELDPEVLVTAYDGSDEDVRTALPTPEWIDDPVWANTRAVKSRRVHLLPGKHLVCISHHIAKAADDLADILHPASSASAECGVRNAEWIAGTRTAELIAGRARLLPSLVPGSTDRTDGDRQRAGSVSDRSLGAGSVEQSTAPLRSRLVELLVPKLCLGTQGREAPLRTVTGAVRPNPFPSRIFPIKQVGSVEQATARSRSRLVDARYSAFRTPHSHRGAIDDW